MVYARARRVHRVLQCGTRPACLPTSVRAPVRASVCARGSAPGRYRVGGRVQVRARVRALHARARTALILGGRSCRRACSRGPGALALRRTASDPELWNVDSSTPSTHSESAPTTNARNRRLTCFVNPLQMRARVREYHGTGTRDGCTSICPGSRAASLKDLSSSSSSSLSERPNRRASVASEYSLTGRKARRMPGALVQASCGHRLEQAGQDSADRDCDGCNESCPDSGAIQWFRCSEGCDFELCGSCHATGYPSAPFPSFFCRWSVEHTSAAFGPCSPARCTALHNAARQGDAGGVKALLAAGSDVHSTDPRGYSLRSRLLSRRLRVGEGVVE